MKTRTIWVALLVCLAPSVAWAQPSLLGVGKIGVGAFGLYDLPLAQEDAEHGPLFGAKARLGVLPVLLAEASATFIRNGDASTESGGKISAPELVSYNLNAVLRSTGLGFSLYFTGGAGFTSVSFPGDLPDGKHFTWNMGLGLEVGLGPISAEAGPRLFVINTDDGGTRKHLGLVAGINYYFN